MIKKVLLYLARLWYSMVRVGSVINMNILRRKNNIYDIANFFLRIVDREAGSTITPLKLQKILYYAQGYYLAINDEPLFNDEFQAWAHGPANIDIYDKYKKYGSCSIPFPTESINVSKDVVEFLSDIWNTFGIYDGKYLEDLTHKESPWLNARKGYSPSQKCQRIIKKEDMKAFFKEKMNV